MKIIRVFFYTLFLTTISNLSFSQLIDCNPDSTKRKRITSKNVPNSYTCYMEMTRGRGLTYGTGMLIHPRVVLTAGHNLAYFPLRSVKKVEAYFGSIDSKNFLASTSVRLRKGKNKYHKNGYWYNWKINRDFAIFILPDSAIYKTVGGHFKLMSVSSIQKPIGEIHITGSPGDKDLFEIWTSSTLNYELSESYVKYDLFTEIRNSGSPIWFENQHEFQVLGLHSRDFGNCNAAVLISDEIYKQISTWCAEAGIKL